jgi:DnaD/phage-associated family protein
MTKKEVIPTRTGEVEEAEIKVSENELFKNDILISAFLSKKLNEVEMKLFNLALYNLQKYNTRQSFVSIVKVDELFSYLGNGEEEKTIRKFALQKYLDNIAEIKITVASDKFLEDKGDDYTQDQSLGIFNLFQGVTLVGRDIIFHWGQRNVHKLLLQKTSKLSLLLDINTLQKLTDKGIVLYELLKLETLENNQRTIDLTVRDLADYYKIKGERVRGRYSHIKNRFLIPAIKEINENTEFTITLPNEHTQGTFIENKKGCKVLSVSLSWTMDKPEYYPTKRQLVKLKELHSQFEQFNDNYLNNRFYQDIKNKTGKPEVLTRSNANEIIKQGIALIKDVKTELGLYDKKYEYALKVKPYEKYFGNFPNVKIEDKDKIDFAFKIEQFNEEDRISIIDLLLNHAKQAKMKTWKYVTTILQDWIDGGARSYEEVKILYDNRVAPLSAPDQTKSTPKGSSKKTNIPEWSNPNYKSKTTQEDKKELSVKRAKLLVKLERVSQPVNEIVYNDLYKWLKEEQPELTDYELNKQASKLTEEALQKYMDE